VLRSLLRVKPGSKERMNDTRRGLPSRLPPIAFGNQTISLAPASSFAALQRRAETHGFASLTHARFALIAYNRRLAKEQCCPRPQGRITAASRIKHDLRLFVNNFSGPQISPLRIAGFRPNSPSIRAFNGWPFYFPALTRRRCSFCEARWNPPASWRARNWL
jgi:hypothetical protein